MGQSLFRTTFIVQVCLSILVFKINWCTITASTDTTEQHWRYFGNAGPDHWPAISEKYCSGRKQSPIRLDNKDSVYDDSLPRHIFKIPDLNKADDYSVYNDGYKIGMHMENTNFTIGLFKTTEICLRPHGLHFHWGSKDSIGSEHWLNNRQYAMEGHLVTWNCGRYSDFETALHGIDGLSVLGFFYEVAETAPEDFYLQKIIDTFTKVKQCKDCYENIDSSVQQHIHAFDISQILPENTQDYWRYYGSLTTPDCRENVDWTVFNTPKLIPPKQMNTFRQLLFPPVDGESRPMVNNFRNLMPLNPPSPPGAWRQVTRSFKVVEDERIPQICKVEREKISSIRKVVNSAQITRISKEVILASMLLATTKLF